MVSKASILALFLVFSMPALAEDAAGDWIGALDGGFKVRVHIDRSATGYRGNLINPSGNSTAFDQVFSDEQHLQFAVAKLNLSYEGTWDGERKIWDGKLTFQQVYPLTLRRATADDLSPAVHRRPQEAAIGASSALYEQREVQFDNPASHNRLAGTLSAPRGAGLFPAIVLISGTGRNTRDEDVWGHKVFLVLADALNKCGLAVLRYDKRGVGGSSGDYDVATTADFTSDATAAVSWLRAQPRIDPQRIGVLGHSEGGIIAPAVAARDKSVAFVVMIAGPGVRGDKLFVLQSAMTARAYGAPDDYIAKRKVFDEALFAAVTSAPSDAQALARARTLVANAVKTKVVDPAEAETLPGEVARPWERYFLAYDPAQTLAKLKAPVLALNGSLDVQVPPEEDLAAIRSALKANPDATVVELPGMNHLLQDARTGAPSEYNDIEETMSPAALDLIANWVSGHSR